MKVCPTCNKTYDDNVLTCPVDDTPTVEAKQRIEDAFQKALLSGVETVAFNRRKYYAKHPEQRPVQADAQAIVDKYGNLSGGFSTATALIPGPAGMVSILPELGTLIKMQIDLVYDMAVAFGKEDDITPDVLLAVLASGMGASSLSLITMHGQKVLIKRSGLRVMQKIAAMLGTKMTQRAIKAAVSRWIPIVGAGAMGIYTKYSTEKIGNYSKSVFEKELELDQSEIENSDALSNIEIAEFEEYEDKFYELKLKCYINLIKADGVIAPEELSFLQEFSNDSPDTLKELSSDSKHDLDFTELKAEDEEKNGLMLSLVMLAVRDNEFHEAEKDYIREVGVELGFSNEEIEDFIDLA